MSDRTKPERKPFFSIGDEIDNKAEQLARLKGIPTLTPPAALEAPPAHIVPGPSNDKPASSAGEGRRSIKTEAAPSQAPRTVRTSYVKVKCGDYLLDQLYETARKERVTLNHLILSALREKGFHVEEADMIEDGRRLRGKAALGPNGQM